MRKIYLTTLGCMALLSSVHAGSFQLNLQGIRQTAMGGTGVAWPWDASSIFYNPGGLARLKRLQAYGSVNFVSPHVKYVQTPTGGYSAETNAHLSTPFGVYIAGNIKKDSKLAVGVGVYTPFGSTA